MQSFIIDSDPIIENGTRPSLPLTELQPMNERVGEINTNPDLYDGQILFLLSSNSPPLRLHCFLGRYRLKGAFVLDQNSNHQALLPLKTAVALFNSEGQVLCQRRSQCVESAGQWSLPGGYISSDKVALSELASQKMFLEVGVDRTRCHHFDPAGFIVDPMAAAVIYRATIDDSTCLRPANKLIDDLLWSDLDNLPRPFVSSHSRAASLFV